MALTKETIVDKIEVLESGQVQVRTATRVLEDGEVLSSSFHRHVLAPGDDTTNEDAKVVAIANATWTTDVITAYNDMIAAQETI
jgi:hypothetical protein